MFPVHEQFLSAEIEYRRQRIASDYAASRAARSGRRLRRARRLRVPEQRSGEEWMA